MNAHPMLVSICSRFHHGPILLVPGRQVLGRSSACDLRVLDRSISRRHAEITVAEPGVTVVDLGSSNGTFLAGGRVRSCRVANGQSIGFGSVTFVLVVKAPDLGEANSDIDTDRDQVPSEQREAGPPTPGLSHAQKRVFDLLVEGLGEKQIAARLAISQHTVHHHVRAIYARHAVSSRAELLALLLQTRRS